MIWRNITDTRTEGGARVRCDRSELRCATGSTSWLGWAWNVPTNDCARVVAVCRVIEQHEAQLEADRWMVAIRSLAAAGPHLTGTAWMENQRAVDIAMRAHERAVRRAYG